MAKIYTYNGFTGNARELAEHFEINQATLTSRLKNGMSIEEAIETPIKEYYSQGKFYTYNGFTGNISQIAEHFGINSVTLAERLRNGMSIEEAIETPGKEEKIYNYKNFIGNISQLAKHFGIDKAILSLRLKNGMSIEEAIEVPLNIQLNRIREYNGVNGTLKELCEYFNKDFEKVYMKMHKELKTLEKAMEEG